MASQYFALLDGTQKGPFPVESLKSYGVKPETMVWCKGMEAWLPARDVSELRAIFPWTPPKKAAPPAAAETSKPESPKKEPAKKTKPDREPLMERWNDLEPRTKYIIGGVTAAIVVVPLLIWAFSGKGGASSSRFPVVERDKSTDEDVNPALKKTQPKQPGKKPAGKQPGGKQVAVKPNPFARQPNPFAIQPVDSTLPAGKFTEEYYRLARVLTPDQTVGNPVGGVARQPQQQLAELESLASEAKDAVIRQIARDAAAFRKEAPTRRPGVFNTARATFRPDLLVERLDGKSVDPKQFENEMRGRKLWSALMEHVRTGLTNSAAVTPGLIDVRVNAPTVSKPVNAVTNVKLLAKNTSLRELHHCTLEILLETPWGQKTIRHFYRDRWKADSEWALSPGDIWGADGLLQTDAVTAKLWCDEGVQPALRRNDPERFETLVKRGLETINAELNRGNYIAMLPVAQGMAANSEIRQEQRDTASLFAAEMKRLRREHLALLSATRPDAAFIGKWWFGKHFGDIALTFERTSNARTALPVPRFGANLPQNNARPVESTPVTARIFDPRIPPEYKLLTGVIAFEPKTRQFLLTLQGANASTAVTGVPSSVHDTTRNYLLKQDTREFRFTAVDGELRGETPLGDQFLFVPKETAAASQRLADWNLGDIYLIPPENAMTVKRFPPQLFPKRAEQPPATLPWSPGEIRRLGVETEATSKTSTRVQRVEPVSQVIFNANTRSVFAVYNNAATASWTSRSNKREFAGKTGGPVAISPSRRELVVAAAGGTKIFDLKSARQQRKKLDDGSTVVGFSPDGKLLYTADKNGRLDVWDRSDKKLMTAKHSTGVVAVAISPDNKLVFAATDDRRISIWDLSDKGKFVGLLNGSESAVKSIDVSPDGSRVLTVADHIPATGKPDRPAFGNPFVASQLQNRRTLQCEISIWDVPSKRKVHTSVIGRNVTCIDFSPDWRTALVGERDGPVSLWNLERGVETHRLVGHSKPVRCVTFSDDGRFAATGSEDGWVILWGLPAMSQSGSLVKTPSPQKTGETTPVVNATKPETAAEIKRREAMRTLRFAESALKAGSRISAFRFLKEAERTAGDDPAVQREIERIRGRL